MCDTNLKIDRIRLCRCGHGTYHMCLGGVTLHLTARELLLVGQTVNRWVQNHPMTLAALREEEWDRLNRSIWIG